MCRNAKKNYVEIGFVKTLIILICRSELRLSILKNANYFNTQ